MKKVLMLIVLGVVLFAGCRKDLDMDNTPDDPGNIDNMSEMVVNPQFDWQTVQDVAVDVLSNANAVLYVKSTEGLVYHKSKVPSGAWYRANISIPADKTKVVLVLAGQEQTINITNGQVVASFN